MGTAALPLEYIHRNTQTQHTLTHTLNSVTGSHRQTRKIDS